MSRRPWRALAPTSSTWASPSFVSDRHRHPNTTTTCRHHQPPPKQAGLLPPPRRRRHRRRVHHSTELVYPTPTYHLRTTCSPRGVQHDPLQEPAGHERGEPSASGRVCGGAAGVHLHHDRQPRQGEQAAACAWRSGIAQKVTRAALQRPPRTTRHPPPATRQLPPPPAAPSPSVPTVTVIDAGRLTWRTRGQSSNILRTRGRR